MSSGVICLAGGTGGRIVYTYDGTTWSDTLSNATTVFTQPIQGFDSCGNFWVACATGGTSLGYSNDGITWNVCTNTVITSCRNVIFNNDRWIAVGSGTNNMVYSNDGITWAAATSGSTIFTGSTEGYCIIAITSTILFAGANGGTGTQKLAVSVDNGLTWALHSSTILNTQILDFAYNGTTLVAVGVGTGTHIMYSTNASSGASATWTSAAVSPFGTYGKSVDWNGATFLAVGSNNSVSSSATGSSWATTNSVAGISSNEKTIAWHGQFWILSQAWTSASQLPLMKSTNGTTWTTMTSPFPNTSGTIAYALSCQKLKMTFYINAANTSQSFTVNTAGTLSVDWGDGTSNLSAASGTLTHNFATVGNYTTVVYGSQNITTYSANGSLRLTRILSSGGYVPTDLTFINSRSIIYVGYWNISNIIYLTYTFYNITAFNQDIGGWNVGNVTSMLNMFQNATAFNGNIGGWNVGNVTSMNSMFNGATAFNGNIGGWNVGKVSGMNSMFYGATAFNGNIGGWNVGNVTTMFATFLNAYAFNQNIGGWNVGNVTNIGYMFKNAIAFNGNIGGWNVGKATDMTQMFNGATAFNGNIGGWNVGNVTTMNAMFYGATAFNGNIGGWNVGNVTNMGSMFISATTFNQDIGGWNVGNVTTMLSMFQSETAFNGNIGGWNVGNVTTMQGMFQSATAFNGNIGGWNVSKVINMNTMFTGAIAFNQDIGGWNVGNVTTMLNMFNSAKAFNGNIGGWNVGKVTTMLGMFQSANTFNQNIGGWNVGNVINMYGMFSSATAFNQNIGGWNVGNVTTMSVMFANATAFNGNIGGWNVGKTADMSQMFYGATTFNQNIGGWNVGNVTTMSQMFNGATTFNGNIGGWNVSKVIYMNTMFAGAIAFNQDIGGWNVGNVITIGQMFNGATAFNGNIGGWIVGNVTNMNATFLNAYAFNQNIGGWNVSKTTIMTSTFSGANNFNANIGGWNIGNVVSIDRMFLNATAFNGNIELWNTANVNTMSQMFANATTFNKNIGGWNTGNATTMANMFNGATAFNGNIESWNTGNVITIDGMFQGATAFNKNIGGWNTGNATTMANMFNGATAFNGNIESWNTGNVITIDGMFQGATTFNKNIGGWNVIKTTNVSSMFANATAFNGNVGDWNTVNATNMSLMFQNARSFNQDIGGWNTGNASNMAQMFSGATAFNGNIGDWNVGNVSNMTGILSGATSFDKPLGNWNLKSATTATFDNNSFYNCTLSTENSSATVVGWNRSELPINITVPAKWNIAGDSARTAYGNLRVARGFLLTASSLNTGLVVGPTSIDASLNTASATFSLNYYSLYANTVASNVYKLQYNGGADIATFTATSSLANGYCAFTNVPVINGANVVLRVYNSTTSTTYGNIFNVHVVNDTLTVSPILNGLVLTPTQPKSFEVYTYDNKIGYYYSLDGGSTYTLISSATTPITVNGLTNAAGYSITTKYITNFGNSANTSLVSSTPFLIGTAPVITSVDATTINFTPSTGANPVITDYYYSVNGGSTYTKSTPAGTAITISPSLNTGSLYTVNMYGYSNVGNTAISANFLYGLSGTNPNIISVSSQANSLLVAFNLSTGSAYTPTYYYSVNGNVAASYIEIPEANITTGSPNTFVIYGLTTKTVANVSLLAYYTFGNFYSSTTVLQTPYVVGTTVPSIVQVRSGYSNLTVQYSGVLDANPAPYYYYSVNGQTYSNSSLNTTSGNITIPGLTVAGNYTVQIMAVNQSGNVVSANSFGFPQVFGLQPNIISVASGANSITLSFQPANGYPQQTYYYSLSGNSATSYTTANSSVDLNSNVMVISNLFATSVYSVNLLALNLLGNIYSNNSVSAQPYTLGTVPSITRINSNLNSLIVEFAETVSGYPVPYYYYSVNGQTYANTGKTSNVGNITISALTVAGTYTVQLIAVNPAGNLISGTVNGQPYILGTQPNVSSVASLANAISIGFQTSTGGYPSPTYYYSLNGGSTYSTANITESSSSSLTVGNLTTAATYSVSVAAVSLAGNVYSGTVLPGQPYVLGTAPLITNVKSNLNSLIVSFNSSVGAYTDPFYYYSVDGNATYSNTGFNSNSSNIVISGLTVANTYGVRLIAVNQAGNVISNSVNGQPYILGTNPNIISVAPKANSLSISFQPSVGGYDEPVYYYSLDGGSTYSNANVVNQTANTMVVGNLYTATQYTVGFLAINAAGNAYSLTSFQQTPYVVGTTVPVITNVQSGANSLTVSFNGGAAGANPTPYYYYSVNGAAFANTGQTSNADITIPSLTVAGNYTVQIIAVNPAGNLLSINSFGFPYVLGTASPNITNVRSDINSLVVSFTGAAGANPTPYYYYSVNGAAFANTGQTSNANITIPSLTVAGTYTIRLRSVNPAGNLESGSATGQPYVVGTQPNIISVGNLANSLSVSFQAVSGWFPQPTYYYSVAGNNATSYVLASVSGNSFTIPNLFVANTYYVDLVAVNTAGNLYSDSIKTGNPYVLGTATPNIKSLRSGINSLVVVFDGASGAFPEPYYYYSVNGGTFINSGQNSNTDLTISSLTIGGNYRVQLMSVSPAGNLVSGNAFGFPYTVGTAPSITNVQISGNTLIIGFTGSANANPQPYYYYSVGGSEFANSGLNVASSSLAINNVSLADSYPVKLRAVNVVGNIDSTVYDYTPPNRTGLKRAFMNEFLLYKRALTSQEVGFIYNNPTFVSFTSQASQFRGSFPIIQQVYSGVNSIIVNYDGVKDANPPPYYYYSVDGNVFSNSGVNSNSSNITILNMNTLGTRSIQLMTVSPAGNVYSSTVYGQPYVLGTSPDIISVDPLINALSVSFRISTDGYDSPTYYYSLSGNTAYLAANIIGSANSFVISGLTTNAVRNVSLVAVNKAGNIYSTNTVSQTPYVVGSENPNILRIYSGINSLLVSFAASQNANPEPYYYYSVGGAAFVNSNLRSNAGNLVIPGLTVAGTYSIQLRAVNAAGNLESGSATGQPYVVGTQPNIISVGNLANSLSVSFQAVSGWNPQPTYYYSVAGNSAASYVQATVVDNSFIIPNLFVANTYYVDLVAVNPAGNLYSDSIKTGNPYVLGTASPNITNVRSGINSLVVSFTGAEGANPTPYYYYSVNGAAFANTGQTSNANIVINDLTVAGTYTVRLRSVNPAGNLDSGTATGQPYVVGTQPNIISVGNLANSLSVSFQAVSGWNPQPTYYYSVAGNSAASYVQATVVDNSFIIPNLFVANTYYVDLVAVNTAGNLYSDSIKTGNPYVLGTASPNITNVRSGINSLVVSFDGASGAFPEPYYYYSVNGAAFTNSNQNSNTDITISGLTVAGTYTVRLRSVNPAGNLDSGTATGQPYVVGTQPNIISVGNLANSLSVSFQAVSGWFPSPTYYYSVAGNSAASYVQATVVDNSFIIPNLFVANTYYVDLVAVNTAGNLYSDSIKTGNPYVLGTASPNITNVRSGINSLVVSFDGASGAFPEPYYYYSVNGAAFANTGQTSNANIVINDLTVAGTYTVRLRSVNPAGNLESGSATGQPYVVGTQPNIISVGNLANSLSVSFQAVSGWNPQPTYYYSVSGNNATSYVLATVVDNSFIIPNLFVANTYYVDLVAVNPAGNLYSESIKTGNPYVLGTATPNIKSIISGVNQLTVVFDGAAGANPEPYYYYSVNGAAFANTGQTSNANIVINDLTVAGTYTIRLRSVNPAGNLDSGTATGQPYVVGTQPNIISVGNLANSLSVSFQAVSGWFPSPTYYYSVAGNNATSYVQATVFDNSFIIPNLFVANTYYVDLVAVNTAGNLYSDSIKTGNPYVLGTASPNITNVRSGINSLVVSFDGASGAFPEPYYYYSVNGAAFTNSNQNSNTDITISGLTVAGTYTVRLRSVNPAGNLDSGTATGQPYVVGTQPNIISVGNLANSLSVSFQAVSGWFPQPTYYYSVAGNNATSYVLASVSGNSFTIPNLFVANTYYVDLVAVNQAGNLYSDSIKTGNPYVLGTASPNITNVRSGINSLVVSFDGASGAFPEPYYYYSVNGAAFANTGQTSNANIVINDLTVAGTYSVRLRSVNPAGNLESGSATGQPYVVGTQPNIISVGNLANSLSVSFQAVSGWFPQPTYYYSVSGNNAASYVLASVSGNSFTIPNLFVANTYYVDLVAVNTAGNLYSDSIKTGNPYVLGTASPNITNVRSGINSLVVSFDGASGAFPQPYYYYSVNGAVFTNSNQNSNTDITISGLTVAGSYTIRLLASNPAGNLESNDVAGQPYVLGTTPQISNISSNLRSLIVSFTSSVGAYPTPYYYYSIDGGAFVNSGLTSNSTNIIVANLTTAKPYSITVMAVNVAGNLVSNMEYATPYIIGTRPTIIDVISQLNGVLINFSGSTAGYPPPATYYYTLDGGNTIIDSHANTSPISVGNLTANTYYVGIFATNEAGNTELSNIVEGTPYILGEPPVIVDVVSDFNSLIINFVGSVGGTPSPYTYLYSLNGVDYVDSATNTSPIVIGNLDAPIIHSVSIKAVNLAGTTAPSNTIYREPYVIGYPPVITVESALNSLIIYWTDISGGYPEPYTYLYSLDGINYIDSSSNISPIVVSGLTTVINYTVSLKAVNLVGISAPSNAVAATPYIVGSAPVLNSLTTIVNGFSVNFSGGNDGYPSPSTYLYSLDGGNTYIDSGSTTSPFTIDGLSPLKKYAVVLKSVNAAGISLPSNAIEKNPFITITEPTITSVVPLANSVLQINFTPSPGIYDNPFVYLYSLNGSSFVDTECVASPIYISNYSVGDEIRLIGVMEVSAISASGSQQIPYVVGTAPNILSVSSLTNGLTVWFDPPRGGHPQPTTYFYSLDGGDYVDSGVNSSPLIIGNLTELRSYSVSLIARNLVGNTAASNSGNGRPYVVGTAPNIVSVEKSNNGLIVNFTVSVGGYPEPTTYLFSIDGGVNYVDSGTVVSPLEITNLSPVEIYTVSLKALSSGGLSAASNAVQTSPYSVLSAPIITGLSGNLTIAFQPCSNAVVYPYPIVYYYSLNSDGEFVGQFNYSNSPLIVQGSSTDSVSLRGVMEITSESNQRSGRPYIIGTPPVITYIESILNGLIVNFNPGQGEYPDTTTYYYSLNNGNTYVDAETTVSPITIGGFTATIRCSVVLIAHNLGGNTLPSNMVVQTPYIIGTTPVITEVASEVNSLLVYFEPSVGGFPEPASYYYSIDGAAYIDSGSLESPLVIPVSSQPGVKYTVRVKMYNTLALGTASNAVQGQPYVVGYAPQIIRLESEFQEIAVSFNNNGAYPTPTQYYYSIDGGVSYILASQTGSPFAVIGLTSNSTYSIIMYSVNEAGASPVSSGVSIWTKSSASFFRDIINPSYNRLMPIYAGNQPNNNTVITNGTNQTGISTKQKYSQYVKNPRR